MRVVFYCLAVLLVACSTIIAQQTTEGVSFPAGVLTTQSPAVSSSGLIFTVPFMSAAPTGPATKTFGSQSLLVPGDTGNLQVAAGKKYKPIVLPGVNIAASFVILGALGLGALAFL